MEMTIAIVEDEQHCTDRIMAFLKPYSDRVRVICFNSLDSALEGLESERPEILFLDVMIGEKTGFDLLSKIANPDFCLIFTTSYEQYALDAFKLSAIDYLLKPIDRIDFDKAITKAFEKIDHKQLKERVGVLMNHLSHIHTSKKISIPSKEGYVFLTIQDILRCEADVNYTHVITVNAKKYTVSKTLKYFEALLKDFGFFRIHNSHLINLKCVNGYSKSGYVTLMNGLVLEISVRRKDAFVHAIGAYMVG
ncbi:LytTR family DNA-binding domain-containing protein [Algoriphagus halophytocola]|uniref:LytTR family DNA-binding domain-containing protein n=1 Tax=Algoriphagus halophytocola TaxID=2991499 RepID=A0ABY6MKS8_9BACT|nr:MULTISPECIES: LytTR family DNA-binding domain-containing protein [unclassified Algoriphagus]UZD23564.1 LytTR family DNA-binding domain-containing protein [Algoriphagus sp. TR-M5]WBL44858.1 LytTR family DNA-binding domain-containing protein [Algoriphagus sp. TR-M9]